MTLHQTNFTDASSNAAWHEMAKHHAGWGDIAFGRGDLDVAAQHYSTALRLMPTFAACWCNLGTVYMREGRTNEAISLYMKTLSLSPQHWTARSNLAEALVTTKNIPIARALLEELVAERPREPSLHARLGRLCHDVGQLDQALACFARAVELDPNDHESIRWIGGIQQKNGDLVSAYASYLRAQHIRPLITRAAIKLPAAFRVLKLYDPFGGNTPSEYLFGTCPYETNTLALLGRAEIAIEPLRESGDIVVNLIADADQSSSLPRAAELADRLAMPIVNHPRKVLRTTREEIAQLLQGIADCRMPRLLRYRRDGEPLPAELPFALPILARPAGTHGGEDFEKFDDVAALAGFLERFPDREFYLSEYVDYGSDDGYFRKYRFIFVDGQILPYHLAIDASWKIHHNSTDMVAHAWMQDEEKAFLADPTTVFAPRHFQAMHEIRNRIGLEYSGIDCALDRSGSLLVFEANACMLVHDENPSFPYKAPFVHAIKAAFDAMLEKMARGVCETATA